MDFDQIEQIFREIFENKEDFIFLFECLFYIDNEFAL